MVWKYFEDAAAALSSSGKPLSKKCSDAHEKTTTCRVLKEGIGIQKNKRIKEVATEQSTSNLLRGMTMIHIMGLDKRSFFIMTKKACSSYGTVVAKEVKQPKTYFKETEVDSTKQTASITFRNVKLICNGNKILIRLKSSTAGRKLLLSVIQSVALTMFSQRRNNKAPIYGSNCGSSTKNCNLDSLFFSSKRAAIQSFDLDLFQKGPYLVTQNLTNFRMPSKSVKSHTHISYMNKDIFISLYINYISHLCI